MVAESGNHLIKKIKLETAYTLGFLLGGGLMTKTNSIFNIYLLPFTFLLFNFKNKKIISVFVKWLAFIAIAVLISKSY